MKIQLLGIQFYMEQRQDIYMLPGKREKDLLLEILELMP